MRRRVSRVTAILNRVTVDPEGENRAGETEQPSASLHGQISRVTGRRAQGGQRGLPALDRLSLSMSDGTTHDFGPPSLGEQGTLELLAPIPAGFDFVGASGSKPVCPICIDGDPTHKEHVPQKNLGGRAMTTTCQACNNGLGSKVEAELQNWFDHALTRVAFDHDGEVPGKRRAPTIYYRRDEDSDAFALFVDGELTPEVRHMFASGHLNINYREPDPRRYRLALLKHAYLSACLHLRFVPDSKEARAIRAALIAARDTPRNERPPESEAARRLAVYRSHVGTQGPPLALVARRAADEETEPEVLISLAGALFVSWPFTDLPPGSWHQTSPSID